jgi:hypothetical protein
VSGARHAVAGRVRHAAATLRAGAGTLQHGIRQRREPDRWTLASPARLHHVQPDAITHLTRERLPESRRGLRTGGDWDVDALAIDELTLTHVLRARFVDELDWDRAGLVGTSTAGGALAEVPGLGTRYVEIGPEELVKRRDALDRLHASLLRDGWLDHHAVGAPFTRELALAIGRDGRLIRNSGGLHRLILARIIGIPSVPVRVLTEHDLLATLPEALSGR